MNIAQTSPLYEYWKSDQGDDEETKRLLKLNAKEPASNLFRYEPYKWENLYQSVLRKVIDGDESSIISFFEGRGESCHVYLFFKWINPSTKTITH